MMENKKLDEYFKSALANHSEMPSDRVWSGIEAGLGHSDGNGRKYLWLLLLLIPIFAGAYFGYEIYQMDSRISALEKQEISSDTEGSNTEKVNGSENPELTSAPNPENSISITQSDDSDELKEESLATAESNTENDEAKADDGINEEEKDSIAESRETRSSNLSPSSGSAAKSSISFNQGLIMKTSLPDGKNITPGAESLSSPTLTTTSLQYQSAPSEKKVFTSSEALNVNQAFYPIDPIGIKTEVQAPVFDSRQREIDYYDKNRGKWHIFVYGMANYTHRRIVDDNLDDEIRNALDQAENGLVTPGAGFELGRSIGKSFRLSIGLELNQWIQEGEYKTNVPSESVEFNSITSSPIPEYAYGGSFQSSLGLNEFSVITDQNPFGEEFTIVIPMNETLEACLQTRNEINYLSIPITAEYLFKSNRWLMTLGGGFSINQILSNDISVRLEGLDPSAMIEVQEVSGTFFAFRAGVGFEYTLTERMALRLNPSYRGWMTPIFENDDFRTLPFGVSLRTGLVYRLGL